MITVILFRCQRLCANCSCCWGCQPQRALDSPVWVQGESGLGSPFSSHPAPLSAPVAHFRVGQPRTASGRQAARKSVRRGWAFLGRAVGLAGGLMTLQVLSGKIFTFGFVEIGCPLATGHGLQVGAFSIMALLGEISPSHPLWSRADPNGSQLHPLVPTPSSPNSHQRGPKAALSWAPATRASFN